jgi:hypothetical protein
LRQSGGKPEQTIVAGTLEHEVLRLYHTAARRFRKICAWTQEGW